MILDPEGGCEEEAMALRSRDGVMVEGESRPRPQSLFSPLTAILPRVRPRSLRTVLSGRLDHHRDI
jgi:hypothetical protein